MAVRPVDVDGDGDGDDQRCPFTSPSPSTTTSTSTTTSPSARARTGAGGFTLIEVLVAVSILAVAASLVWGAFSQTLKTKEKLEAIEARYAGVRLAMNRMARDLSMAYLSKHDVPGTTEPRTFFKGESHFSSGKVSFSAMSHVRMYRDAKESDTSIVTYFVDADRHDMTRHHLYRRESRRIGDEHAEDEGQAYVACEDVDALKLEYFDTLQDDWTDSWDTVNADGTPDRLPARVRITLSIRDEHRQTLKFVTETQIFLTDPIWFSG